MGGGAITIKDGELEFTGANALGDTLKTKIVDQYGQAIPNTKFKANGTYINDGDNLFAEKEIIEYAAGDVAGRFTIINSYQRGLMVTATYTGATTEVTNQAELVKALKAAAASTTVDTIEVAADITLTAEVTIPEGDELVIPYGLSVTTTKDVINNGTIRGSETAGSNTALTAGTFKIDGTGLTTSPKFTNNGVVDLPGSSLELVDTVVTGSGIIAGHVIIDGDVIFDADSAQALVDGTQISMAGPAATMTVASELTIVGDVDGSAPADDAAVTLESSTGTETELNTGHVEGAMKLSDGGADGKPATDEGEFLVATPDDFISAINLADAIILAHDIDLSESAIAKSIFTEDTTIDLNGFDLTVAKDHSIWVSGAQLTLTDSSTGDNGDLIGSTDQSAITAMNTGLKKAALVVDPDCLGTNASLGTYFFADQEGAAKPVVTLTSHPSAAEVKIKASAFSTVVELNTNDVIAALNADTARAAAPVAVYIDNSALSLTNSNSTWTAGATTANKEYRADLTVTVPKSV